MDFNLIDLAVLAIIGVSVVFGLYQGFLVSVMHLAGFFVSWLVASTFHGRLAAWVTENTNLAEMIYGYAQGSVSIGDPQLASTAVSQLTPQQAAAAAEIAGGLPAPFNTLIPENIQAMVFQTLGQTSLTEYFDATLSQFILNALCYIVLFFGCTVAFWILIAIVDAVRRLPVLKFFDSVLGGALGLARGVIIAFVLFLIAPIVLTILPVDIVQESIETSRSAAFFYERNPLYDVVK